MKAFGLMAGVLTGISLLTAQLPAHAAARAVHRTSQVTASPIHQTRFTRVHTPCVKNSTSTRAPLSQSRHRSAVGRHARCFASAAMHTRSRSRASVTSALRQFRPHLVGNIFGVGSFVTQRSWTISPLIVSRAHQLGTRWVREEFTASRLHSSTRGQYWWSDYDRIVNEERRAGLHILGLLDYSNTWSYGDHGTMPHQDMRRLSADFARYAYDVVRHFRGRVSDWEVWNEPNLDTFWHPSPDASDYATLLTAASRAVKRGDRHAKVVLAGTSGVDLSFIREVTRHTHSFDIVAVHPYRGLPESSFLKQVRALRGLHKPIWFSEIGWAAGKGCDSCYGEAEQARYLVRFYALAAAAGIQRVFWYDLRDDPHSPSDPEAHFGLLRRDLSGKPSFAAYAYLARLLDGSKYTGADWLGQHGLYTLRFQRGSTHIAVLWNASDRTRQLTLKWHFPEADFVTSAGDVLAQLTPNAGHVTVTAPQGGEPFYLIDRVPDYHVPVLDALLHFAPPPPPATPRPSPTTIRTRVALAPTTTRAAWVAGKKRAASTPRSVATRGSEHGVRLPTPHPTLTASPAMPGPTLPPHP